MKFIKKITVLIVLSVLPLAGWAQEEENEDANELHVFRGGYMDVNFGLNVNTVGSSLGSGSMGGVISSRVSNGALSVNLNPAHLTNLKKGYLAIDTRLGLGTNYISSVNKELLKTVNEELDTAVNDEFSNEASWTTFPETYIKPTEMRSLDVGFDDEIASIAFAAPISDNFTLAGAYTYPVSVNLDFGVTGLSAKLAQEQGTDEVAIRFDVLMNISLLTQMNFRMSSLSLGGGAKIFDTRRKKLSVGATVTRYELTNTRNLQADLSGLVVVGGADERYFNDPNDPNLNRDLGESNSFFMNAYGEFAATEYGTRLGLYYNLDDEFNLSIVYNQMPTFQMRGTNKVASAFLPVFLVGTGDEVLSGDIEVALDSLQANKPNLTTERDISSLVSDGELQIPSSLLLGIDFGLGKHTMAFNYSRYFGDLSFKHGSTTIGKAATHGLGLGFDFRMRDRWVSPAQILTLPVRLLFLDIDGLIFQSLGRFTGYKNSHYRIGGNVIIGEGIATNDNESLRNNLGNPLPQSFSMGRQYTIFGNLDVGVTVLAVPDLMLKYSVGIRF
ncbi:MAG: hypothetical protein JJ966_04700 [Balneolaceae bacterium]|jgi:hypothetical protein|nr:hypothetical protein [Balneolaceae bacterium]